MAIDASVPGEPGWWMQLLWRELAAKQKRLTILDNYFIGRPPLVLGTKNQQAVFYKLQQIARSNFAALIVGARRERLAVRAIRTAADRNENGDDRAWQLFQANSLDIAMSDLARYVCVFGEGYLATAGQDLPLITAEDPRQTISYEDPTTRQTIAAFKLFHDYLLDQDFAILWLAGVRYVAAKSRKLTPPPQHFAQGPPPPPRVTFSPSAFDMLPFATDFEDPTQAPQIVSERYDLQEIPVTRVLNRDGVGEFELHTDLMDRINHTILQRVVITTMQAFKQRALELKEDLPKFDEKGQVINYDDIFSADPGALWKLPPGAKIWESLEVTLTGVLASIKDDVLHMAAVTKTPLSMFTPDAVNQSAEGAMNSKEGLVFSVEDLQRLIGRGIARSFYIAFKLQNDEVRADLGSISIEWFPAQRFSLAEQAAADAQAQSLTWEQRQVIIWQRTPTQVKIAQTQRAQDALAGFVAKPPPPQVTAAPAPRQITAGNG